jgi:hypothetical protein
MSSPSTSAPPAKRAKQAPVTWPSWTLRPVKNGEKGPIEGPIEGPKNAPSGEIDEDFKELADMMDLISGNSGDTFFTTFKKEYLKGIYNDPMEGERLMYAKITLAAIVDFLYKYVLKKGGGVLKTRTLYVPQATYATIQSSFLEEWMPVIEEGEEYGGLVYGNYIAFILALTRVAKSDNPCKALGLKELP